APLTTSISRFRSTTTTQRGKWGNTTITGGLNDPQVLPRTVPGDTVFLQVKAWDFDKNGGIGNVNNTYENAISPKGQSLVFTYRVPPPTDPPSAFYMENQSEEHTSELQSHLNLVCRLL